MKSRSLGQLSARETDEKMRERLEKLLRMLSRDGAFLQETACKNVPGSISKDEGRGKNSGFLLYTKGADENRQISQTDAILVRHCIRSDLLEKSEDGWFLGSNGRLALRRLISGADPFASQHRHLRRDKRDLGSEEGMREVLINDSASPLGWLSQRKDADGNPMINRTQFEAGERLARDFQFAGLQTRITSSWSLDSQDKRKASSGNGSEMSDNKIAAQQRVRSALKDVGGELAGLLLDICCFQQGLGGVEKARGWPRRSARIILLIALDRLADHYGMGKSQQQRTESSRIAHWGTSDYRPEM